MRCALDGTNQPDPLDDKWVIDEAWGLVHYMSSWHTIMGTKLKRLSDDTFVAWTHKPDPGGGYPAIPGDVPPPGL